MSRPGEEDHDRACRSREDAECVTRGEESERKQIVEWLRSADAGAYFGSSTWGLRQQIIRGLERGMHKNWRDRVDSTY